MIQTHFGWTKDLEDLRDVIFTPAIPPDRLPALVDLSATPFEPPVTNQLPLQSCSAHALAALVQFVRAKEGMPAIVPSRLFIYYNERAAEGTTATDSGAKIRDGIKTIIKLGVCAEELWPYDPAKFADAPPQPCYDAAAPHKTLSYSRMAGGLDHLKSCLAQGYPFVFGMSVFKNITRPEAAHTGVVGMPDPGEAPLGGHAVVAVGYDSAAQTFRIRNSLGAAWGMRGYFTLPDAFMDSRNCTDDFWMIRQTG